MQQGSLIRSARKRGPDVWQFRWIGDRTESASIASGLSEQLANAPTRTLPAER
jgi:hypothetical protein